MAKYVSGRQKNLKVGISSYSENLTSIEVIGNVGIATTNATSRLYVVGDGYFTGIITASNFYIGGNLVSGGSSFTQITVSGITTLGVTSTTNLTAQQLNVSGISTLGVVTAGNIYSTGVVTATTFSGTLSGFASSAGIATYATNAGIATYATNAGIATYATNAGIATYATNAGIATYATNAGVSTYATNAGIATYATNAGIATYATNAGIATYATNAGIATYATNAGIATYATNAGIATYATNAGIATYATNAGIATYATNAGIATYATNAGIATYATNAGIATYATNAGIATYATNAGIATYATNAGIATYATNAGIATALQYQRTFEITGDIVGSPISFDGTGNVSIAATIQPNSVGLGTDTTGDYVQSITGTSNQISVSATSGEGSTPTLSIPSQFTAPQDVTVTRDLQVNRNLNVTGNITIGGTSATLFTETLTVSDSDIVIGFRTDAFGNDASNDTTANHGGIAVASTEGNPLVNLNIAGIETLPPTYKKIMWFKSGSFAGLGTDAWLINYAVGIGSTQFPTGTRFAAGSVQFTENDLAVVRNINSSGVVTAATLNSTVGIITNLTGVAGTITNFNATVGIITNLTGVAGTITNFNATVGIITNLTGVAGTITNFNATVGIITNLTGINLNYSGISTFTNGPVLIGTTTATGTASQRLQVTGGAYFSGIGASVGIGTTNPQFKLDVNGDINFNGTFYQNGSQFVASRWDSGTGNNIYRLNGNVGVGTTNPTQSLDVNGGLRLRGALFDVNDQSGTLNQVLISTGSGVDWVDAAPADAISGLTIKKDNDTVGSPNSVSSINFVSGNLTATASGVGATITLTDNPTFTGVGIGTTNPGATLNVVPTATSIAGLFSGTTSRDMVRITQLGTGNALVVEDETNPDSTPFVVTGIGSVGIGTTNPITKLHVIGDVRVSGILTANRIFSELYGEFVGGSISGTNIVGTSLSISGISTFTNGPVLIGTATSTGTASQRLQVDGGAYVSGSIGVGITNPIGLTTGSTQTLHLNGTTAVLRVGPYYSAGGDRDNILLVADQYDTYLRSNNERFHIYNNSGDILLHGTSDVENIRITASGNVGIGTTNPTSTLTVVGGASISGLTTTNNLYVAGVGTFLSSGLKIRNPANTFNYIITGGAIAADRTLNLPVITTTDTVAVLGFSQAFTQTQTFSGTLTGSGTVDLTGTAAGISHNFGTNQTTSTLTFGGTSGTGTITLGRATTSQTTNIQAGVTASGNTKTINFGTLGATGSFTQINIGPTAGVGTVVINSGTNLLIGTATTTGTASQRLQVDGGAYVSDFVGIGTTNPTSTLTVVGNGLFSGTGIVTATTFVGALTGTATTATTALGFSTTASINTTGIVTASQLVSNVAQGTAPITVGSSTLVTNLNANYLNGQLGSYYTDATNLTGTISSSRLTGSYGISITGTATTATNLSDAVNITTGIINSARLSGTYDINVSYANTAGIATIAQGLTGTPNITVGIVTATSYNGSGTNLTGIVTSIVAGSNITVSGPNGQVTINAAGGLDILEVMLFA